MPKKFMPALFVALTTAASTGSPPFARHVAPLGPTVTVSLYDLTRAMAPAAGRRFGTPPVSATSAIREIDDGCL